jgi:hypothetical protein
MEGREERGHMFYLHVTKELISHLISKLSCIARDIDLCESQAN